MALAAALPAHARDCVPPAIDVTQDDPTRATLTWTASGAAEYFLQYSTGKFPTQLSAAATQKGETVSVLLYGLRPGRTVTIAFCETETAGACPGPDSDAVCNTQIEVTAALARPGIAQPDPALAICSMTADVAWSGHPIGSAEESMVPADSAQSCCQQCGWAEPWLPYVGQCTHFIFDPTAQRCYFYRDAAGTTALRGATSGLMQAWPQPR